MTLQLERGKKDLGEGERSIGRAGFGYKADDDSIVQKQKVGEISFVKSTNKLLENESSGADNSIVSSTAGDDDDPMKAQLAEFMAEINSLDCEDEIKKQKEEVDKADIEACGQVKDVKGNEPSTKHKEECSLVDDSGVGVYTREITEEHDQKEAPPLPEPRKPAAPHSDWQAVFDDNHQCYYYWNVKNGKSVWEIPKEYEKFLESYRDFEVKMAMYEIDYQAWKSECESFRKETRLEAKNSQSALNGVERTDTTKDAAVNKSSKNDAVQTKNKNSLISLVNYSLNDDENEEEEEDDEEEDVTNNKINNIISDTDEGHDKKSLSDDNDVTNSTKKKKVPTATLR